jgi:eukaryotic-like serine/threonine-protein kinase
MRLPSRYKPTGQTFSGGGMSDAIVCEDRHLERLVLVKQLQVGNDEGRLLDEIRALSEIRSKHVVQIFDVLRDEDGKIWAFVEEFLPGDDLNKIIPDLDEETFIRTAHAIATGIADIHEHNRLHRDIKPPNLKFDAEGCLKIFDFGLSRLEGAEAKTVGAIGTPGYWAPELCVGDYEEAHFTKAIDVYAFGATALKMARGEIPKDLRVTPPSLPSTDTDFSNQPLAIPKPIAEMLNRCLASDPNDRPQIRELRDLLASHLLRNKHRATLVGSAVHMLGSDNPLVKISAGSIGSIQIKYDGLAFVVSAVSGDVSINNVPVSPNDKLPTSCVITLGHVDLGSSRRYVTFDLAHPEVL